MFTVKFPADESSGNSDVLHVSDGTGFAFHFLKFQEYLQNLHFIVIQDIYRDLCSIL